MEKLDGGPAFPRPSNRAIIVTPDPPIASRFWKVEEQEIDGAESGMSLRDYFAAKAMLGFTTALKIQDVAIYSAKKISIQSYQLADAMLAEREK